MKQLYAINLNAEKSSRLRENREWVQPAWSRKEEQDSLPGRSEAGSSVKEREGGTAVEKRGRAGGHPSRQGQKPDGNLPSYYEERGNSTGVGTTATPGTNHLYELGHSGRRGF